MRSLFLALALIGSAHAEPYTYDFSKLSPEDVAHIGRLLAREQSEAADAFNKSKDLADRMQKQISAKDDEYKKAQKAEENPPGP